jgi:hypothetical protein
MTRQTGSHMEALGVMVGPVVRRPGSKVLGGQRHIEEKIIEEFERVGDRNHLVNVLGEAALTKSRFGASRRGPRDCRERPVDRERGDIGDR